MKRWTVRVDWFVDDVPVLQSESDNPVQPDDCPISLLREIAGVCSASGDLGEVALRMDGVSWNKRTTVISIANDVQLRSVTITQGCRTSPQEADQFAARMVEWILADETAEILGA